MKKQPSRFSRLSKLHFSLFAVWLIISLSITNGKAQGLDTLDRYTAYCGTTAEFQHDLGIYIDAVRNGLSPLNTSFTYKTKQQFLAAGGTPVYCAGGRFAVYYDDFLYSPLDGFAEPTLGPDRRATLCAVLEYIESVIEIPSAIVVELFVARSHSPSNTAPVGTKWLGKAKPLYAIPTSNGIVDGNMYSHIVNGVDPDPTEHDAWMQMNFDEVYDIFNNPMNLCYFDNFSVVDGNLCCWDLYTVLLHEVTHSLGWISFLTENTSGFAESIWAPLNSYSKYDSDFLYHGDIHTLTFTKLITTAPAIDPSLSSLQNILTGGATGDDPRIWLYNNGIPHNQPILSGGFPNWPNNALGSEKSHFDDQRFTFPYRSQYSPGHHPEYVMGASLTQQLLKRQWSLPEMRALFNMQYPINPAFASSTSLSYNGTDLNSFILFNNSAPYRNNNSTAIFGDFTNPEFPESSPADYTIVNNNTAGFPNTNQVTIDISTDVTIQDNELHTITVFPNSVFGLRGVSVGGNNHDALILDPTHTIFTYTPPPGFVGRAQFGFYLFDGHEKGNLKIYTIEVTPGTAYTVAFGDNMVINGDFEDGTEVRTRFGAVNLAKPYSSYEADYKTGYQLGCHLAGGHPFNYYGFWPYNGGTIVRDALKNCNWPSNPPTIGHFGSFVNSQTSGLGGAHAHPAPMVTGSLNDRYHSFNGNVNYSTLSNPVQPCSTYTFEFDINFPSSSFNIGDPFHIDLHFTDDPGTNPSGNTIYQTVGIDLTVDAVNNANDSYWQHVSVDLWYCAATPARFINLETSTTNWYHILAIDNLSLKERTHQPLSVDAGSDHSISNTCNASGCVPLNVTANNNAPDNTRCGFTYSWTPATGLSDPAIANPIACPAATTTYTVEVTDPCTGEIATDEVTIYVLPPGQACLSIDKSVVPSQGNALTNFVFTIVACNTGNTPEQVTLTDNLPAGAINVVSNLPITSITIPAGACNTYTVTCNIPANGVACNMIQITDVNNNVMEEDACVTINNSSCILSPPRYVDYINYTASGNTTITGNVFIAGTFTVSPGSNITFDGCDIYMADNARIIVAHDAILNITTAGTPTYMYGGCGYMWDGIYIMGGTGTQNDGILNINNGTRIEDAIYAVYSDNDGGDFHIDNSFFDLNYVSVHAFNRGHFGFSNITGNQFDASGPLKPTLAPAPMVTNTFAHIDAQNINEIITADNNTFNPGSEYGIYSLKVGRLESFQNRFTKPAKAGIYGEYVKEMIVNDFNAFTQCPSGIECYQTDLRVDNQNSFTSGNFGIVAAKKSSCKVTNQNLFSENKVGIYTNYYTYTNIDNNVFDKEFVDILCWATYGTIIISNNVMNDPELASVFSLNNIFNTTTVQHIHHNQISNTNPNANNPNINTATGIVSLNNSNTNRDYNIIEWNRIQDIGYGIQLTKSDYSKVTDNEISLPENDNTFIDYRGINAEVSNNCIIGKNLVHGRFVPEFITAGTGIHVTNSSRVWEICNVVDNLFNGLLWESNSFGAILFANSMIECAQDLYLKNVFAGLGQQYLLFGGTYMPFDNQWINNVTVNWHIANELSNVGSPSETEFVVRTTPSQYLPTSQTIILGGNTSQISTPTNITPVPIDCSIVQYSIPKDESREALMIARDSIDFQPGEEGLKWMSQEYLFNLLKAQPQLLLDYPEMIAAQTALETMPVADFNTLNDTLIITSDSTVQSVQADTLDLLDLDSLALAKAAELKALNDALVVQQQIEENKRIMNDVYLNTSAIGITAYSPAQLSNIRNIAAQCPATGGPSVYEARTLLMLIDSVRADYSASCAGLLRIAASTSKNPVNFIGRMYPNPSTGVVNYDYRMEKNSIGTISITNVWGQVLKSVPLNEGLNKLEIDCSHFADGMYLYQVVVNNTTIARDKLTIIKE